MLPDVALLRIFDFYIDEERIEEWHTLVHVCRIWRNVVLGSPRRLNLRLCCTGTKPVRNMLDVWPPLPIVVFDNGYKMLSVGNIIAALEHNDRVCDIELWRRRLPRSPKEMVLLAMQRPFPALTNLRLVSREEEVGFLDSDSFLGGSAPRLRSLWFNCVPFPGLPKLLLSATRLVDLRLWRIPHSGYISPEAMVAGLSALTRLEKLVIRFESPHSHPEPDLPTMARTLLPALTYLRFKGVCGYLEDVVARIDAPLLKDLNISFSINVYLTHRNLLSSSAARPGCWRHTMKHASSFLVRTLRSHFRVHSTSTAR